MNFVILPYSLFLLILGILMLVYIFFEPDPIPDTTYSGERL